MKKELLVVVLSILVAALMTLAAVAIGLTVGVEMWIYRGSEIPLWLSKSIATVLLLGSASIAVSMPFFISFFAWRWFHS